MCGCITEDSVSCAVQCPVYHDLLPLHVDHSTSLIWLSYTRSNVAPNPQIQYSMENSVLVLWVIYRWPQLSFFKETVSPRADCCYHRHTCETRHNSLVTITLYVLRVTNLVCTAVKSFSYSWALPVGDEPYLYTLTIVAAIISLQLSTLYQSTCWSERVECKATAAHTSRNWTMDHSI